MAALAPPPPTQYAPYQWQTGGGYGNGTWGGGGGFGGYMPKAAPGPQYGEPGYVPKTSDDFKKMVEEGLQTYRGKAFGLENTEESRGASMEQYLRDASNAANKPTITQDQIDQRFAGRSDQASGGFLDQMAGLREYMGASGVTGGGLPAGIAANAEMQRIGQLTQARGDLMAFKATADAQDRMKAFDRATTVGNAINRPVSMLGMDAEQGTLQARLAELGVQTSAEGAKDSANATRSAGKDAKTGSIISGGLGALGAK